MYRQGSGAAACSADHDPTSEPPQVMLAHVNGIPAEATPGTAAICPGCAQSVRAKCGRIKIWHWSHVAADCDPWSEPESMWHRDWKACAPIDKREVVMERDDEKHRADVITMHGKVLELQASPISVEEIERREKFYGDMAWLFRATWAERLHFGKHGFWWKHGAVSQIAIKKPLFWDLGGEVVRVELGFGTETVEILKHQPPGFNWSRFTKIRQSSTEICVWATGPSNRVVGKITKRWSTIAFMRALFGDRILGL